MGIVPSAAIICEDEAASKQFEETTTITAVQSIDLPHSQQPSSEAPSCLQEHQDVLPDPSTSKLSNTEQRRELLELQQQIKVQLFQQQVLVQSIQALPQICDDDDAGAPPPSDSALTAAGCVRAGPNPDGDTPADDPEDEAPAVRVAARIDPEEVAAELPSDVHRAQAPARSLNNGCRHAAAMTGSSGASSSSAGPRWPVQETPVELPPLSVDRPLSSVERPPPLSVVDRPVCARVEAELRAGAPGGPPGREERRWIEAAVRRIFRSIGPSSLDAIAESFREQRLRAGVPIVQQAAPIATGPGLCVLFEGVVDVLHLPRGGTESERVCTYDRCGQCFGELELCYDAPRAGAGRTRHWATISTRTAVTLWTVDREVLRGHIPGASRSIAECI